MKNVIPDIKPKDGFGDISFGINTEALTKMLGEPEEIETFDDDGAFKTTILNYWDLGISAFFEGMDNAVLSCLETDITDATLFGKKVFDMDEAEIIALMGAHGFEVAETEIEEDGEKRVSYDDALIDFFFHEGELVAVNWGVLVNEQGEIEEM